MPSATFTLFHPFFEALPEKVHDLGSDQLVVALLAAANAPNATDADLGDLTEVSYTNLSGSNPRNITTSSSEQSSGTYKLILTDLVLTASGGDVGPFRYIVIYNDTASNDELIGYLDYGSDITIGASETFTLDFHATNGILQLALAA